MTGRCGRRRSTAQHVTGVGNESHQKVSILHATTADRAIGYGRYGMDVEFRCVG